MLQGQRIKLEANREHYASMGEPPSLSCSVLDHFFGAYSAMHTFTQTEVRETVTGEVLTWPQGWGHDAWCKGNLLRGVHHTPSFRRNGCSPIISTRKGTRAKMSCAEDTGAARAVTRFPGQRHRFHLPARSEPDKFSSPRHSSGSTAPRRPCPRSTRKTLLKRPPTTGTSPGTLSTSSTARVSPVLQVLGQI